MNPRIYTYKITFEEVPYYYYGVHKEKVFDEEYWGSPETNKWCWELYTPVKQILEMFEYSEKGWLEAQEVEKRIIKPVYRTDKWCLNENCGGLISLEVCRKNGKKQYEQRIGIHAQTPEQRSELGRKGGKKSGRKNYELGIGIHAQTPEQRSELGKKQYEQRIGIHALTPEQRSEIGKKGGKKSGRKNYELGIGIHAQTPEQRSELGKKIHELGIGIHALTPEQRRENSKKGAMIVQEKYSKEFTLISPEGEVVKGKNIKKFCRENNLNRANITKVLSGKRKQHNGWRKYIPDKITILDFL